MTCPDNPLLSHLISISYPSFLLEPRAGGFLCVLLYYGLDLVLLVVGLHIVSCSFFIVVSELAMCWQQQSRLYILRLFHLALYSIMGLVL